MLDNYSNPLYRCVDVRQQGQRLHVVERHRLTGRYRRRAVPLDD